LRLGLTGAGHVAVAQRPRTGRGAYVCPRWRCLRRALQKGGLHRALRTSATVPAPDEILRQARSALSHRQLRLAASGGATRERERLKALLARLENLGERLLVDGAGCVGKVAHRNRDVGPEGGPAKAHG